MKLETYENAELNAKIRVVEMDGAEWFVAKDVCDALGIANSRDALDRLDEDEKGVGQIDTLGGRQNMGVVTESGLYALILRSDKPSARKFRKWITSEVIPAIRRNDYYARPDRPEVFARMSPALRRVFCQRLRVEDAECHVKIEANRRTMDVIRAAEEIPGHLAVREWLAANRLMLHHRELSWLGRRLSTAARRGDITTGQKTIPVANLARAQRVPSYAPEAIAAAYAAVCPPTLALGADAIDGKEGA